jgi:DNA-binding winged helix-turn-helix (wHTH) protein/predicted ATPase
MFRFGDFELTDGARELRRGGRAVALRERALAILEALVEKPGEIVSKRELCRRAWPDRDVDENNLQVEVLALRRVLGKDAIVTASGRGYQFALPVERRRETDAGPRPLLGRETDLAALTGLLSAGALVTLTGEGGIGKSALARALRESRESAHPGTTHFLAFDGATEPRTILAAAERRLATTPTRLLILDGCDHALDLVSTFAQHLGDVAARTATLVTSRELLRVPRERVYRLAGLSLQSSTDDDGPLNVSGMTNSPKRSQAEPAAMRLFRDALGPRRAAEDPSLLASICRALEGHPLALILAARRVADIGGPAVLSLLERADAQAWDGIAGDVDREGQGPARHRSLHALVAWSDARLSALERSVWHAAAILEQPFALDDLWRAASMVRHDRWDVADGLARLVDRSLVAVDGEDPPRYRLSAIARPYAKRLPAP